MAISANDIRKGMVILHEGNPVKVMEFHHHTPGNLRAMVQAKLRNLRTGNQFDHRFRSNDDIEQAYISQHEMEYLYSDGHAHHFMNTENFEQSEISEADLGEANRDAPKGDSGVSERIMQAWMRFLSDPRIRGRVVMVNCTNRPDRMDAAMKRSGRSDDPATINALFEKVVDVLERERKARDTSSSA